MPSYRYLVVGGGMTGDAAWRGTPQFGVDMHLGREIVALDLDARRATDDAGETYEYERLLLATGGTPRRLPGAPDGVVFYRTFDDYRRLRELVGEGVPVVVIGGGFIGS